MDNEVIKWMVKMDNEVIIALIGVGGTLAGTVLGWVLNNITNRGKLQIYTSKWKDCFERHDNYGGVCSAESRSETNGLSCDYSLDMYNSTGNVRIMRDIKFVLSDDKNDFETQIPNDATTRRTSAGRVRFDEINALNIPPKTVMRLDLHNGIWNHECIPDFIWKVKKVYLTYTDEKNKSHRVLIKDVDYENRFTRYEEK